DEFRPGQKQIISAILSGRDVMAVLPTGGGKSLSYQVPALLLPGVTIVVSPLISLMKDQVDQLVELGVNAVMINGAMSVQQVNAALDEVMTGGAKLLYVAPERMESARFMDLLRVLEVPLLVVDEAHCVSQWGHDFRPSYLRIADMIHGLSRRPVVAAFTATATPRVREDIEVQLELNDPERVTTGFDRPNLRFAVENLKPTQRIAYIARYVRAHPGLPGIVYCATRKRVEELAAQLRRLGVNALGYHAGMADEDRERNQDAFLRDEATAMVATNAFGMGIDKSNVRYVIHDGMSGSIEAYWQEAGRAGRDGEPAECILLYSAGDQFIRRALIEQSEGDEEHKRQELEKLRRMEQYAVTGGCLRNFILEYFGEHRDEPCRNCSNCEQPSDCDVTREAQMALSCVARMERGGRRYGATMVRDVLAGSANARIKQARLDENPCYGLMKGADKAEISAFLQRLVQDGLLYVTDGEYPVLGTTDEARAVLRGDQPVMQRRPGPLERASEAPTTKRRSGKTPRNRPAMDDMDLTAFAGDAPERSGGRDARKSGALENPLEDALMQELRELRMTIAREINKPPFMVFSDATLRDMIRKRPMTLDELEQVTGVGSVKRDRFGKRFINVIAAHTGGDGLHRRVACRSALELLMRCRDEWLAGLEPEQAQDAYDYVLSLLEQAGADR
ncbi:MAG: DNA helicase RecQ, partial [Clostridia bacterium]|nr:DNA helicase RecQ [Clostridia bacterium]